MNRAVNEAYSYIHWCKLHQTAWHSHHPSATNLEIATHVLNIHTPCHGAAQLKGHLQRAQLDANDAKWKIARGHKNPLQDVNKDSKVYPFMDGLIAKNLNST